MATPDPTPEAERQAHTERLWQLLLHLDNALFQRGNLFLVAQSLQLVAYVGALSAADGSGGSPRHSLLAARVIAAFGIVLALTWLYSMHRHHSYGRGIRSRLDPLFPEYQAARRASRGRGPSHMPMIVYGLPTLAGVMWIVLLTIG
ncbi:hypothetical protein ACFWFB_30820 [Streptomyces albidoflavus]